MPLHFKESQLVDLVWTEACDGRWHSLEEVAKRARTSCRKVGLVVDFLEKYGFVRSCVRDGRRFRIDPGAPSPMEVAGGLRSLLRACGADLPRRYIF